MWRRREGWGAVGSLFVVGEQSGARVRWDAEERGRGENVDEREVVCVPRAEEDVIDVGDERAVCGRGSQTQSFLSWRASYRRRL